MHDIKKQTQKNNNMSKMKREPLNNNTNNNNNNNFRLTSLQNKRLNYRVVPHYITKN